MSQRLVARPGRRPDAEPASGRTQGLEKGFDYKKVLKAFKKGAPRPARASPFWQMRGCRGPRVALPVAPGRAAACAGCCGAQRLGRQGLARAASERPVPV